MPGRNSPPKLDPGRSGLDAGRPNTVDLIEEAEAQAARAEALAEAARARVRAIRQRQPVEATESAPSQAAEATEIDGDSSPSDGETHAPDGEVIVDAGESDTAESPVDRGGEPP